MGKAAHATPIIVMAILIAAAARAQTQQGSAKDDVTTVSPLVVSGGVVVGPGATFFAPEQLAEQAEAARQSQLDARDAGRGCGVTALPKIWTGSFGIGVLSFQEGQAQWDAWRATLEAEEATRAFLAVRTRAGATQAELEAAELARQRAVVEAQRLQQKAVIAEWRVKDLIEMAQATVGSIGSIIALERGYYHADCSYDMQGNPASSGRQCADRASGENMQQFAAEVEERAIYREKNKAYGRILYTPRMYRDLRLAQVTVRERVEKGTPVLRVSGRLVNTRDNAIAIPALWVSVVDRYGTEIRSEQIEAPRGTGRIRARGNLAFTYAMTPPPDRSAKTSVTFAPFHRTDGVVTPAIICPG